MSTKPPPKPAPVANAAAAGYEEKLLPPLKGKRTITSKFGLRKHPVTGIVTPHEGVDISGTTGTPVYASASGKVEVAGTISGYGKYIRIQHGSNTETAYGHLSEILVSVGQNVARGEMIGKVGQTGRVTGPHLHFEVLENNKPVNPNGKQFTVNANDRSADEKASSDQAKATGKKKTINAADAREAEVISALAYDQDEIIRKLLTGTHFKDNAANDFYNLAYNWKFFVTADTEVATAAALTPDSTVHGFYDDLAKFEQVIIAESGVTGFNIDSVSMDAVVGTEFQSASTAFTNFEMRITEPNGAVFLDSLRNSCLKLGVQNYQKHFYYLELTFKGYNEDGSVNLAPFEDMPNGGRWLWTVIITDIQVAMSAGGGTYTLKMTPMADSLLVNRFNVIPLTVELSGSTVGEYMDKLCVDLNDYWSRMYVDPNIIKYEVMFHGVKDVMTADEVRNMTIVPSEPDKNEERSLGFSAAGKTTTVPRDFTISEVLDSLMSSCEKAQQLAVDLVDQTIDMGKKPTMGHRQSVLWRIEPEVHHTGYDPLFNEYCKQFIIHVYGFRNHAVVAAGIEAKQTEDVQKAILADLAYRNFLPKKYEYLFTGANSEVIDVDINFNLKWSAQLPRLADATQEQAETHAKALPDDVRNNQKPSLPRSDVSPQDAAEIAAKSLGRSVDLENAIEEQRALAKRKADGDEVTAEEEAEVVAKIKKALAEFVKNAPFTHKARADRAAQQPYIQPSRNYEREYGENLTNQKTEFEDDIRYNKAFPITIRVEEADSIPGNTGQWHAGKSIYGAIWNQVYGPMATQFFQIEMTVRGDPYWIGAGAFEQLITRRSEIWGDNTPNFSEGCNAFLFKMLYPLGQDDDGNIILNTNETVTGIYQINHITHKFENGKFTQVFKALRIPLIDLYRSLYKKLHPTEETTPE